MLVIITSNINNNFGQLLMAAIPVFGIRILFIIALLSLLGHSLKHSKVQHRKKQDASMQRVTGVEKTSKSIKKSEQTNKQKNEEQSLKEERMSVEEQSDQQKNKNKDHEKQEESSGESVKANNVLDIARSENHYVVPITIQKNKYNLSILYDEKSSYYGQVPSWIFTNLTGKDHQICNTNNDCEDATRFVKCHQSDEQESDGCVVTGKAVYKTDKMMSKKKVRIGFQNNNKQMSWQFASPSKVTLADDYSADEIHGVLNLGMKQFNKIETDIVMLSSKQVLVANHSEMDQKLKEDGVISLVKTGYFHFTSGKNIYISTASAKTGKITNDIKQSFQKVKIKFNNVNSTMAVPKGMLTVIRNILEKEYFGDRCHDNDQSYVCAAPPVKNITAMMFCMESGATNCLHFPILNFILREEKKNKVFTFLVDSNKDQGEAESATIVLYPPVADHYEIIAKNGVVAGVKPLKSTQQRIKQGLQKVGGVEESGKQKASKQEEQETQGQSQSLQQEQAKSQAPKNKELEESTKEQTEKQSRVSKQDASVEQQQNSQQDKEQSQSQNMSEQPEQKPQHKNKKTGKSTKSKSQHLEIDPKPNSPQSTQHEKKEYSKIALLAVILYGLIFIVILIVIKLKQQESLAASLIDRLLDNKLSAFAKGFFNKNQGYNAPKFDDQEDIDRSDSVTVGYGEKEGRDLFWQKNSVEGI